MMLTRAAPLLMLFGPLLAGCPQPTSKKKRPLETTPAGASTTDTAPPPEVPRWIEVGTGDLEHVPLSIDPSVLVVFGGQGGFHVDVSGEIHGLGEIVEVRVWVRRTDTGELLGQGTPHGTAMRLADYDDDTRAGRFMGERAFFPNGALSAICPLQGIELEVEVLAEDLAARGTLAEGLATGVATVDPDALSSCGTAP